MTLVCRTQNTVAIAVIAIAGLAASFDARAAGRDGEYAAFLQRVVAETTKSGFTVRSTRELRAGTTSGKHQGWMAVETVQGSAGEFTWTVLTEGGSERTRNKVFRELLQGRSAGVARGIERRGRADAGELRVRAAAARRMDARCAFSSSHAAKIRDSSIGTLTVSEDGRP